MGVSKVNHCEKNPILRGKWGGGITWCDSKVLLSKNSILCGRGRQVNCCEKSNFVQRGGGGGVTYYDRQSHLL